MAVQVLNFYSTIFADELKRGRKTATIRLGDKSHRYRKNQLVLVSIGYQYSPRERIFEAVIDQVEVMKLAELSPRDIKHDNPEFRRHEELIGFLEQIYGRAVSPDDIVTVVRFSQIVDNPPGLTQAMKGFGGAQN
ncbi:MAG: ASCH domain-containing protein [Solirubrobacteraceae bacterium]